MIVYNVKRRWFTMKADAEAYRKAEGLPKGATFKLTIDSRDALAELLNGLCGLPYGGAVEQTPPEVIERNRVTEEPPDWVPKFLVDEWEAKRKGTYRP